MDNCFICKKKGIWLFDVEDKQVFHCQICDLTWTRNFNPPNYKSYHNDATYADCTELFQNIFERVYAKSTHNLEKKGRVFEVGASVGNLLLVYKKHGWEVFGVEPSAKARKEAAKKGITLLAGDFEKLKIQKNFYDLVVINHTLEHVSDPLAVMRKIHSMLKKNGLVVIGVPNFGSLSAKMMKQNWPHLLVHEHKWHFSPKSLALLTQKAGFSPQVFYTSSGLFEFARPMHELWNSFTGLKKRFFTNLLTLPGSTVSTLLNKGTGLLLIARK